MTNKTDVPGETDEAGDESTVVVDALIDSAESGPVQCELPLAMVDGSPVTQLPDDLYIPPDALEIFLESFQGPLDLLLYLIRRQNMDILNINVSRITRQYMEYIRFMEDMRFELAAEYLVMAAMLAEIKSRCLLPKRELDDDEEIDPRAELIRRLQEYERFKTAAERLDQVARVERDIYFPQADILRQQLQKPIPDVSLDDLFAALRGVLKRSELFEHHQVEREKLSTRERMSQILADLSSEQFTSFTDLFTPAEGRLGVVVTFLALLELVKESLIELVQADLLGPIHIRCRVKRRDSINSDEMAEDMPGSPLV